MKKELPLQNNQYIEIRPEDARMLKNMSKSQNGKKDGDQSVNQDYNLEDFDDCLYDTVTPLINQYIKNNSKKSNKAQTEIGYLQSQHIFINSYGQVRENWLKEDHQLRSKVEK